MVTFLRVWIPVVEHVGVTNRCSLPIIGRGERARVGHIPRPRVHEVPWHASGDRPSSWGTDWPQTTAGQLRELAGRPAIFTNGTPAPPVTSFAASKSFYWSVDGTEAHDMTLASDASFNSRIFLAAAAVDRARKGSMVGERMNKSFGREVREKEMIWGI
jgi:hypothetical protein